jgi:hypothetical protein
MMNKGLGKLILIAGLGLGALYFLKSDNKKVSNSEVKKETKEHPSLDKETIETIVEDHKEEKKEEEQLKRAEYILKNNSLSDDYIKNLKEGNEKVMGGIPHSIWLKVLKNYKDEKKHEEFLEKLDESSKPWNKYDKEISKYSDDAKKGLKIYYSLDSSQKMSDLFEEYKNKTGKKVSDENFYEYVYKNNRRKEFLAKMKAGREKKKLSKAEAGALGGEATADLGKHKGHKTKKGLVQDQNKVSKEEHEKHYQDVKSK